MMKLLALVFALAFAVSQQEVSAQCITIYTRPPGATKTFGNITYTGITQNFPSENYNNMLYYDLKVATAATVTPAGRLIGTLSNITATGNLAFEFFKTKSWITIYFGKGTFATANVITGGTGCFTGWTGTATRTKALDVPLIFKWALCLPAQRCTATGA